MEILETFRKNFNESGFKPDDIILNKYNVWFILVFISVFLSNILYIVYEVKTIEEYMRTIFMINAGCGIFLSFLDMIVKKTELNNLIDDIQAIITKSKEWKTLNLTVPSPIVIHNLGASISVRMSARMAVCECLCKSANVGCE